MKKVLLIGVVICMLVACGNNEVKEPQNLQFSAAEKELVQECNDFSFNLLSQVAQREERENVILSPLSASMLLGMLMNGAEGETLSQMQAVLGFESNVSIEEINAYYRQLITVLPDLDPYTELDLANGIWVREAFPVKDTFVNTCRQQFDALVKNVPTFVDERVLREINNYAAQHTKNRIKDVINDEMVDDETVMVLLNALYFKALWKDQFKKTNTRQENFTTLNGVQMQTDMMRQWKKRKYGESDEYQLLELPYKGEKYCADIILPAEGVDIRAFAAGLNAEKWAEMLNNTFWPEVSLTLPKFKLKYDCNLTEDLAALGLSDAFSPGVADFSRLSEQSTYISLIQQKTFMQLDEEGTEAAAVTIGIVAPTSAGDEEHRTVIVNRPFLLILRERDYGTILFTALIGHPEWQK